MRGRGAWQRLQLAVAGCFGLAGAAQAMSYGLIDADLPGCRGACPKIIVASGTIQQNEPQLFSQFIATASAEARLSRLIVIESPGGFNIGAASLGALLRKLKMTVIVGRPAGGPVTRDSGLTASTCASACVLVLAGGAARFYVSGSRVGVHRASTGPEVRDAATREIVSGRIDNENVKWAYSSFFRQMGIDQSLASVMDRTPPDEMYWLSPAELDRYRLARNTSRQR